MSKPKLKPHQKPLYIAIGLVASVAGVALIIIVFRLLSTGVKGSIIVVEGNCMPPTSGQCASESQNTRKMNVALYQSIDKASDGSQTPIGKVAETRNVTNSYKLSARPGKYFLFYRYTDSDDMKEYCAPVLQTTSQKQEPCEVIIPTAGVAKLNITFNLITY